MSPYHMVFGKPCHLPVELEYNVYWAIKALNFDLDKAGEHRKLQLNEIEELRNDAYYLSKQYKDKMKSIHDKSILRKEFHPGQKVLLYDSRLHLFPGKLKTRWSGSFLVRSTTPYGAITVENPKDGSTFQVNGQRLKSFHELTTSQVEQIDLINPVYQD